jgi:hypothetical protein
MPAPEVQRSAAASRAITRPPLVYILAAFGLLFGAFGAQQALGEGASMLAPRDVYVQAIERRNDLVKPTKDTDAFERYSQREAEVRYARRNAALPLSGVGLILSCLLFAGCLRAMRGDPWGVSAWSLAALASLPYQLISTTLTLLTGRDLARAFANAPAAAAMLDLRNQFATRLLVGAGGVAILYFGLCVLYLRTAEVRRAFSAGGRTPPSA